MINLGTCIKEDLNQKVWEDFGPATPSVWTKIYSNIMPIVDDIVWYQVGTHVWITLNHYKHKKDES
jgi:hypothetical protein